MRFIMTIRLIRAAANNEIALVFNYLRAGDNVNDQENLYGQTALHCALKSRHYETAKLLLHYGANPNIPDDRGFTTYDILDGTYDNYMDNLFTQHLTEETDLLGIGYN